MRISALCVLTFSLLSTTVFAQEELTMKIIRHNTQPIATGSPDFFTGKVEISSPFQATEPARVGGATVSFEAGARTVWHTHPLGQTLIITEGVGWVQAWGGEVQEVTVGDIVWIPENIKHWHGAAAHSNMTHIAIAESLDGSAVEWLEAVSDEQYKK